MYKRKIWITKIVESGTQMGLFEKIKMFSYCTLNFKLRKTEVELCGDLLCPVQRKIDTVVWWNQNNEKLPSSKIQGVPKLNIIPISVTAGNKILTLLKGH